MDAEQGRGKVGRVVALDMYQNHSSVKKYEQIEVVACPRLEFKGEQAWY
jgi:hypothetical protein